MSTKFGINKWYYVGGILLLILATIDFAEMAYATGGSNEHDQTATESTSSSSSMASGGTAYSEGSTSSAIAKGGTATVGNTNAEGGMGGAGGNSAAMGGNGGSGSVGDISIGGDTTPRQAPGVVAIPPQTTAECMVGIGFAGSNRTGAVALSPSWMQKDCWAMKQFELLASLGLHQAAGQSYCSRKINWYSFESRQKCEAEITQALILIAVDAEEIASVKKILPKVTPIQGWLSHKSKKSSPTK